MDLFIVSVESTPLLSTSSFSYEEAAHKYREMKDEAVEAVKKVDPRLIDSILNLDVSVKQYKLSEVKDV